MNYHVRIQYAPTIIINNYTRKIHEPAPPPPDIHRIPHYKINLYEMNGDSGDGEVYWTYTSQHHRRQTSIEINF